jgi:hypothetical protein
LSEVLTALEAVLRPQPRLPLLLEAGLELVDLPAATPGSPQARRCVHCAPASVCAQQQRRSLSPALTASPPPRCTAQTAPCCRQATHREDLVPPHLTLPHSLPPHFHHTPARKPATRYQRQAATGAQQFVTRRFSFLAFSPIRPRMERAYSISDLSFYHAERMTRALW